MLELRYFLVVYRFLRYLLQPLFLVGIVCVPFLRKRRDFEAKNRNDPYACFHKGVNISFCFHIASEGEFEYIIPLATKALKKPDAIEILYTSPSVETAVKSFCEGREGRVFSLRLPLLSVSGDLEKWVQGKNFIMVRYDFYPELLSLALKKTSFLLHATLKNKKNNLLRKMVLNCFNGIIPATKKDQERFEAWKLDSTIFSWLDVRIIRIENRLKEVSKKLQQNPKTALVKKLLQKYAFEKTVIFGSFHEEECIFFENSSLQRDIFFKKAFALVVPHHTETDAMERIIFRLNKFVPVYKINEKTLNEYAKQPGILVFDQRGFLLELYTLFQWAYVGGGYGKGVHSLLEPFMAGLQVFCGPKVFRSTEYDLISSLDEKRVQVVEQLNTFYSFKRKKTEVRSLNIKINIKKHYKEFLEKIQL